MNNKPVFFILTFVCLTSVRAESSFQSHETIYQAAREYIGQNLTASDEYEIDMVPLDSLLTLPACSKPLEAFTTGDLTKVKSGRVAVGVRCNSDKKWSIFISAIVKVYQKVAVLIQPVKRGDTITRGHFSIERREIAKFGDELITRAEQVENKQALRFLPAGTILTAKNIAEPKLVKKGDKIIISASQPGFSVRMNGLAMMDGAKGQIIRIKNQTSGRIVSATVVEPGMVSVNF
ncbi:flagellar basal body P-ring formation chaperone FlgA [Methylosarcina fibrata]|uniref:flagellar basal body P-ring formation chaperone FlgA n=1 Tax=Methylosarcina fibrata TaxID=105972 RepID=UPI00035CFF05|nr:flagellar basal body P-ring formation chaperone FlgA [Methylosarcina fibrata]